MQLHRNMLFIVIFNQICKKNVTLEFKYYKMSTIQNKIILDELA